jgi:hypothetical protein
MYVRKHGPNYSKVSSDVSEAKRSVSWAITSDLVQASIRVLIGQYSAYLTLFHWGNYSPTALAVNIECY